MGVFRRVAVSLFFISIAAQELQAAEKSGGPYNVTGQVVDGEGTPLPNAIVTFGTVPTYFEREEIEFPRTDIKGNFSFETPYPPPFTVSTFDDEHVPLSKQITKSEGDLGLHLVLSRGETLEGVLKVPSAELDVVWASAYFPNTGYEVLTKGVSNGRIRFTGLPVGKCFVTLWAENEGATTRYSCEEAIVILPNTKNRVSATFPDSPTSLVGLVQDTQGSPLVAEVALHIVMEDKEVRFTTKTNAEGQYTFEGVPKGDGRLRITALGMASRLVDVLLDADTQEQEAIQLVAGAPVRCSLVNTPAGTERVQLMLFFGKQDTPTGIVSDVQYLLDQPVAQTQLARDKNITLHNVGPGSYTLMAFPLTKDHTKRGLLRLADALLESPVYLDTFTLREGADSMTIAAAFPGETPRQVANTPIHPVVGQWAYTFKGSTWTRTFTRDGRCILREGGVFGWDYPYVILGTQRVAVLTEGKKRIHTVTKDDRLDVEGAFTGRRIVR